jgi:voltage-gated potassium channel
MSEPTGYSGFTHRRHVPHDVSDRRSATANVAARVFASIGAGGEHGEMTRLARSYVRFQQNPSSLRYAAAAIISTIIVLVLIGSVLIWLTAPGEYDSFGESVWFTLQTVTTVGYGDSTPKSLVGRVIASVVMLVSIGLITVITAVITSLFIRAVTEEQDQADHTAVTESLGRLEASLAAAHERLARMESTPAPMPSPPTGETAP